MSTRTAVPLSLLLAMLMALLSACGSGAPLSTNVEVNPPGPVSLRVPPAVPRIGHRPNILVIETDDMRWDELRWMPNVRRLIERTGLDFANSFAPYPLCCPSRASFLTGKYAHNHHVLSNASPFGFGSFDDHLTIATELQRAGYRTALVGKYLNGYGQMPVPGTGKSSLHYVPPGWTQWYGANTHKWPSGQDVHGGTYNYFNLAQNINGRLVIWPHRYTTSVMGAEARHLLGRFTAHRKPWFLWWTPIAPHQGVPIESDDPSPYPVGGTGRVHSWPTPARPGWVRGVFDAEITHGLGTPLTHSAEADTSDKPAWVRAFPELDTVERGNETTVSRQRAEALYVLDGQIGKTLEYLRRRRQYADTVIVFTSDNGFYLGEHRKREGKVSVHEPSLKVPLLMTGPGIPRGLRYDPVTTVDFAPTFARWARIRGGMPQTDGIDLTPMIRHGDRGWRRAVVTEALMKNRGYADHFTGPLFQTPLDLRGLRLGRWKLTAYSSGEDELYNIARDPLELHNLASPQNLATHPADRLMLHKMLRVWRRYAACAGAQCRRPVPAQFRLRPGQERRITLHELDRTLSWFDDPGLQGGPGQSGVTLSGPGRR